MMTIKKTAALFICLSFACCASAQTKQQKAQAKDPKYQYNMGLVYLNQSSINPANIDEAIKYFVKSLSLDTRFYLAWNAIGLAQSLKGNLDESAKAFQKCLEIYPDFSEARNNLGTIYQEQNQLDKAEAEFRRALQDATYPTRELPYYNLARLYVVENRLDDALTSVDRAIQSKPRLAMAHNLKGMILEKQNKTAEAVPSYEQAVKLVPDDITFNYNLGVAYFKTEEFAKAKDIFTRLSPRATDPDMRDKIAQFLKMIGDKGAS
jgi:type IV pilus assembly protein PilF